MKHIRKGSNHIPIPPRLRSTDPVLADWIGKAVTSLEALRDRIPESSALPPTSKRSGRFIPRIGGEDGNKLFVSPGTISYCQTAEEDTGDEKEGEPGKIVVPVYPTINGTSINADEPEGFDLTGKANGSLWLKSDRTRCPGSSLIPTEDSTETDEIILLGKTEEPDEERNIVFRLLCKFDLEGDTSKSIRNLDQRIASDVEVWFLCEGEDESNADSLGSQDFEGSSDSDETDLSDSNSEDCDWRASAKWMVQLDCYQEGKGYVITWRVVVKIKPIRGKCIEWHAHVAMTKGRPHPYGSNNGAPAQTTDGTSVIRKLTDDTTIFGARFRFPAPVGVPCKEEGFLTIKLVGTAGPEDPDPDPCCKTMTRRVRYVWPGWCHNRNCSRTTIVTPP